MASSAPRFETVEYPVHNPQRARDMLAFQDAFDAGARAAPRRSVNFPLPCNVHEYGMLEVPAGRPTVFSAFPDAGGLASIYSATTPKMVALLRALEAYKPPGATRALVYTESPGVAFAAQSLLCALGVGVELIAADASLEQVLESVGRLNGPRGRAPRVLLSTAVSTFPKRGRPAKVDSIHLLDAENVRDTLCGLVTSVGLCARAAVRVYDGDGTSEGEVDIASLGHHMLPSSHGENAANNIESTGLGDAAREAFNVIVSKFDFSDEK